MFAGPTRCPPRSIRTALGRIDLSAVLRPLATTSAVPRVHLEMPEPLYLDDPAHDNAWLRCVQEIPTNATRHAGARYLWIEFGQDGDGITLHARDDGVGVAELKSRHGLTGMRERIEARGGRVEFNTVPGRGFEVRARPTAPLRLSASGVPTEKPPPLSGQTLSES